MNRIAILGTSTPPPYCDCNVSTAHNHWAIFVEPAPTRRPLLQRRDAASDAAVFDLLGRRLRQRPAFQVEFSAAELPVQIVVGTPAELSRSKLVKAVETVLAKVPTEDIDQDSWMCAGLQTLQDGGMVERFDVVKFHNFAVKTLAPDQGRPASGNGDADVVKQVNYTAELTRRRTNDAREEQDVAEDQREDVQPSSGFCGLFARRRSTKGK